jgi:hypothetical protein
LLKRKSPLKKVFLSSSGLISSGEVSSSAFYTFYETRGDSLAGKTLYVSYDMCIDCKERPFVAWIVAAISDSNGKNLLYERIPLDWLRTEWHGLQNNFLNGMFLSNLPAGSAKISAYIWNLDGVPFRISNGNVSIYEVIPDWK